MILFSKCSSGSLKMKDISRNTYDARFIFILSPPPSKEKCIRVQCNRNAKLPVAKHHADFSSANESAFPIRVVRITRAFQDNGGHGSRLVIGWSTSGSWFCQRPPTARGWPRKFPFRSYVTCICRKSRLTANRLKHRWMAVSTYFSLFIALVQNTQCRENDRVARSISLKWLRSTNVVSTNSIVWKFDIRIFCVRNDRSLVM